MKADLAMQAGPEPQVSLAQFTLSFLKLGCIGFGGPIALVGYMQKDLVDERKWISQEDYLQGLAFSQLAPGPLAAQLAMYLGFVRAGFIGATIVGNPDADIGTGGNDVSANRIRYPDLEEYLPALTIFLPANTMFVFALFAE